MPFSDLRESVEEEVHVYMNFVLQFCKLTHIIAKHSEKLGFWERNINLFESLVFSIAEHYIVLFISHFNFDLQLYNTCTSH